MTGTKRRVSNTKRLIISNSCHNKHTIATTDTTPIITRISLCYFHCLLSTTASSHRHPRDHRVSEQFRPQGVENNRHPYPKPHPQRFQTITYKMAKSKTQQEKEALEQRIAQLESQNAQLKKQKTEAATYTQLVPRLGKKKNDENVKVLKKVIKKILKVKFWRNLKFFPRKRKDEIMIGTKIIMAISDQLPDWQAMSKNQKQQFIVESLPLTASVLNDHRNYVIARIKDSAKLWWDDHKQKLPSVAKIVACMKREIDPSKPADYELMKWYWDDILVKAVGNGTDWAPAVRHYSTISKAAPEDDPNHSYVTEATEAFAVVTYDNCRDAWVEQFKLKDAHGSKTKLQFAQAPEGEEAEFKKEEDKVWMYSPKFRSKWTNMEAGSSRHGGFKREGQDEYKKYQKEVAKV